MKLNKLLLLSSCCIVSVAQAQTQTNKPDSKEPKATMTAGETMTCPIRLKQVEGLDVKGPSDADLGEVKSVLIDPDTGRLVFAVMEVKGLDGENTRLVPWSGFKCDASVEGKEVARTTLTKEKLAAAPAFKKDTIIDAATEKRTYDAYGLMPDKYARKDANSRLVNSDQIKKANVRAAGDQKVGEIEEIAIDPAAGAVAFVVVGAGGFLGMGEHDVAVPWQVLDFKYDNDKDLKVMTDVTKDRMVKAPEHKDADWKKMCSMPWMKSVYDYYTVEPYWVTVTPASTARPN